MWQRNVILIAVGVFLIAITVGLIYGSEPSFEGKTLSTWVVEMNRGPNREYARAVVRQMGTNSLPLLLDWLRRDDQASFDARVEHMKLICHRWLVKCRVVKPGPIRMVGDSKRSYRSLGIRAFSELGPTAAPAIPALIEMLADNGEGTPVAGAAYVVLLTLSPASIQPLINALSSQDIQVWALAARALSTIGPEAKDAIPALQQIVNGKESARRVVAAEAIGRIGGNPDTFIPALALSLHGADADMQSDIVELLLRYKENAKSAVPTLLEALKPDNPALRTNARLREEIVGALKQIDPESAQDAGVK